MNLKELQNMEPAKLKELANKLNVKYHHKAGPTKIAQAIIDQAVVKPQTASTEMKHKAELPKEQPKPFEPEDILKAIKHITDAKPEFKATFPGDGSWIFSYKGAEESGNLAIPLREITMKASTVARGALRATFVKGDGTVGKGYADQIMM